MSSAAACRNWRSPKPAHWITATTQGTRPDPYIQNIRVSRTPNAGIRLSGACTCPVGRGCKHLAAVAIAAQRKEATAGRPQNASLPFVPTRTGSKPVPPPAPVLPSQIQAWLAEFDREEEELTEDYPPSIRTRVLLCPGSRSGCGAGAAAVDRSYDGDAAQGQQPRHDQALCAPPDQHAREVPPPVRPDHPVPSGPAGPTTTARRRTMIPLIRCIGFSPPAGRAGAQPRASPWPKAPNVKVRLLGRPGPMRRSKRCCRWTKALPGLRTPAPWYVDTNAGVDGSRRARHACAPCRALAERARDPAGSGGGGARAADPPVADRQAAGAQRIAAARCCARTDEAALAADQRRAAA